LAAFALDVGVDRRDVSSSLDEVRVRALDSVLSEAHRTPQQTQQIAIPQNLS